MNKEQKIFSFDEVTDLLQSGNNKTKEQAEKEFADWLIKNGKVELVPKEIIEKHFKISDADLHLLRKANFEVLKSQIKN